MNDSQLPKDYEYSFQTLHVDYETGTCEIHSRDSLRGQSIVGIGVCEDSVVRDEGESRIPNRFLLFFFLVYHML